MSIILDLKFKLHEYKSLNIFLILKETQKELLDNFQPNFEQDE